MSGFKLTRESILDGSVRAASRALLGPNARFMTDEERVQQIEAMLQSAPNPERYIADLDLGETARYLASGAGPLGRCCDYLFETVAHLRSLGLRDRHLELLEARVRAHGASAVHT